MLVSTVPLGLAFFVAVYHSSRLHCGVHSHRLGARTHARSQLPCCQQLRESCPGCKCHACAPCSCASVAGSKSMHHWVTSTALTSTRSLFGRQTSGYRVPCADGFHEVE